jgi:DNA-binding response OmpR family regulator
MAKILVIDDHVAEVKALVRGLRGEKHVPLITTAVDEALRMLDEERPDLVVLDLVLASGSGYSLCALMRQRSNVSILIVTSLGDEADRIRGLEMGADDYLVKPVGLPELLTHIKVLLRRERMGVAQVINRHGLFLDYAKREVRVNGQPVTLRRREFELLALLATYPGQVFNRRTLLAQVWNRHENVSDRAQQRTVDVHMRWLREKIEPVPEQPQTLLTVRGVGYKFAD